MFDDGKVYMPELTYWKWKQCITELQLKQAKADMEKLKLQGMVKDLEIAKLKTEIYRLSIVNPASEAYSTAKSDYFKMKREIEQELGVDLNGCVIDELTFEIKKIDKESNG